MKHNYVLALIIATFLTSTAYAAETEKPHRFEPAKTRQEAIAKTKERLADLEKMSDKEWTDKKVEKDKRREDRRARLKERRGTAPAATTRAAPAPAAAAPAAAPVKKQ